MHISRITLALAITPLLSVAAAGQEAGKSRIFVEQKATSGQAIVAQNGTITVDGKTFDVPEGASTQITGGGIQSQTSSKVIDGKTITTVEYNKPPKILKIGDQEHVLEQGKQYTKVFVDGKEVESDQAEDQQTDQAAAAEQDEQAAGHENGKNDSLVSQIKQWFTTQ